MKQKRKRKITEKQRESVLAALEERFPDDRDAQSEWLVKFVEGECNHRKLTLYLDSLEEIRRVIETHSNRLTKIQIE